MEQAVGEYMDTPTLAKLADVDINVIQNDIKRGILPAEKRPDSRSARWGGCWFIRADDAQKYINLRKVVVQSISASELSRRTGKSDNVILEAIKRGELPASRLKDEAKWPWNISEEEAKKYSQRMGWNYVVDRKDQSNGHISDLQEIRIQQCDSCGTARGNILGDIDGNTHKRYGYLCARCSDLVRISKGDLTMISKLRAYLKRTRR